MRSLIWIEMVNYQSLDMWKFYQIPFLVIHNLQHDNFQPFLSTKMYFSPSSQIFIIISELWNRNKLCLYWLATHSNLLSLSAITFQVCWTVICTNPCPIWYCWSPIFFQNCLYQAWRDIHFAFDIFQKMSRVRGLWDITWMQL